MYFRICWKHSPSKCNALTNCFIKPDLMWRGGRIILYLLTIGSWMTFGMPALRVSRFGHSFWVQWFLRSRLSHMQRKHGNLVKPFCWPSKKLTIFRSTHMIQPCWWYLSRSITVLMSSCCSFSTVEWPIGTAPYLFPLCKSTHLRLRLELSKKSRHSSGLYDGMLNSPRSPETLSQ